MLFQFDNIIAGLIATTVVLVMISLQRQSQDVSADAARYYAAKKDEFNLVEMVQHDFQNMRADLLNGPHITELTDSTLQFKAQIDGAGQVVQIGYFRKATGRSAEGSPLYMIERYVEGQKTGSNLGNTIDFIVKLFDDSGQEVTALSALPTVTTVGVTTSGVSNFGAGRFIQRTRWDGMFTPTRVASGT